MDEQTTLILKTLNDLQSSINERFDAVNSRMDKMSDRMEKMEKSTQENFLALNAKMESHQKENRENFLSVRKKLLSIREEHAKFSADLAGAMNIILPVYEQEFSRMDEKLHAVK